ncbi:PDDEXK-like family protein [Hymenobacter sublimis]|uniref:PD-(D/E)XK nuclease family protein n=1 Tax=Hymenobacter sublimis TaxID=2933777 RepID=A0ABY4JBL0_9BACT|nr:PD-(D/E)XK nuclease family protein [Hymenobacter sublimis]UPL50215.1 PD-(D/E)XK nuclease family protein [Hymenobacter sublimis]
MRERLPLQALVSQVSAIEVRYQNQIKATGEQFNIFHILGLQTAEVRTHSAFLAELLNPEGSHGHQGAFLDLFVQQLGFPDFNTRAATVEIEKHIGFISEDGLEGGRIDICLFQLGGHAIFIENKIYAGDQKNQLLRYHTYSPDAKLIYLTLDGSVPGEHSTGGALLPEAVHTLSYAVDIVAWLEACRKEAAMQPLVRETLTQYINLIKRLTGQSTNRRMMEEVKHLLLTSPDTLAGAQHISHAFSQLRSEIQKELFEEFKYAFQRVLDLPEDRLLFTYKGYKVIFSWDNDSRDGYFYGFPIYDQTGKGGICKRSEFDELAASLRTLNSSFKRTNWWAGLINPLGFSKIENCTPQQLFALSSREGRQRVAQETANEAKQYVDRLRQKWHPTVG